MYFAEFDLKCPNLKLTPTGASPVGNRIVISAYNNVHQRLESGNIVIFD